MGTLNITKTVFTLNIVFSIADITPEELFNMFFGGFGGASMSGGKLATETKVIFNYGNHVCQQYTVNIVLLLPLKKLWLHKFIGNTM